MATKYPIIPFPAPPDVADVINRYLQQLRTEHPTTSRAEAVRQLVRAGAQALAVSGDAA